MQPGAPESACAHILKHARQLVICTPAEYGCKAIIAFERHPLHSDNVRMIVCNSGGAGCHSKPRRIANHAAVREPDHRDNQQHGNGQKCIRVVRHLYLGPLGLAHCCERLGYNVPHNKLPTQEFLTHCVFSIITSLLRSCTNCSRTPHPGAVCAASQQGCSGIYNFQPSTISIFQNSPSCSCLYWIQ